MAKSVNKESKSRYGLEFPNEKRKKLPKFSENYEEELIRQLFEEKKKKIESMEIPDMQEEQKDQI
jgi:hypothetical protein